MTVFTKKPNYLLFKKLAILTLPSKYIPESVLFIKSRPNYTEVYNKQKKH